MLRAEDVLLDNGQNLVVSVLTEDKRVSEKSNARFMTGNAFVFKVSAVLKNLNLPFNQFVETGATDYGKLGTESGLDFNYLGDTEDAGSKFGNGNDKLRVTSSNEFQIYHFFPLPLNPTLRLYTRYLSQGSNMSPFEYDGADKPDPTNGDPGWLVRGGDLDNEDLLNPPAWLQHISWYEENDSPFQVGLYNEDKIQEIRPATLLRGRSYQLEPVVNENEKRKIVSGRAPRTFVQVGGTKKVSSGLLPSSWRTVGADIDLQDVSIKQEGRR